MVKRIRVYGSVRWKEKEVWCDRGKKSLGWPSRDGSTRENWIPTCTRDARAIFISIWATAGGRHEWKLRERKREKMAAEMLGVSFRLCLKAKAGRKVVSAWVIYEIDIRNCGKRCPRGLSDIRRPSVTSFPSHFLSPHHWQIVLVWFSHLTNSSHFPVILDPRDFSQETHTTHCFCIKTLIFVNSHAAHFEAESSSSKCRLG